MRAANSLLDKGVYEFDKFRLSTAERSLEHSGRPVSVSPKALDVLIVLVENRGRIVEKDELMRTVWPDTFVEENNLAFNISVLRKMFAEHGASPQYIETVPRRGYRFVVKAVAVKVPEISAPLEIVAGFPEITVRKFPPLQILVAALVTLALVLLLLSRFRPPAGLTEKDTIILADFANKTRDPVFDGTLRQGLIFELEQSPFLSLIGEARVKRTLRMMKRPAEALTPELAQELCQRTGSAIVLAGSIASVGSTYVLGLRATNCGSGTLLDNEQAQVNRKEDVLNALSQIAHRFRLRIGESRESLLKHNVLLADATTASLEALTAYTAAWKIHYSQGATDALPLFKRAIELDPEFAMAHASLGRIYADVDQADLAAESMRRAWQLRNHASDRERFFIVANYHLLATGNLEEARKTSEAWARTYPRDAVPHLMLSGYVNKFRGRFEIGAADASQAIAIDPDFGMAYYNIAVNNTYLDRYGDAYAALQRAAARGLEIDEFLMLQYDLAFVRRDVAEMERVAMRARTRSGPQNWILNNQASVLAYSGRLQQSRSLSRVAVAEAQQAGQAERAGLWETAAALREAFSGNALAAEERAKAALKQSKNPEVEYGAAFALALAGHSVEARKLADEMERRFPDDTTIHSYYLPVLRAQLAINHREPAKAIEILQSTSANEFGVPRSVVHGFFGGLYSVWVRGEAYLVLRRYAEAAAEFQKILDHRGIVVADPIGALARLQRGRALVLAGDKEKAKLTYLDFLTLWTDADPQLAILRQAKAEYKRLLISQQVRLAVPSMAVKRTLKASHAESRGYGLFATARHL